MFDTDECIQASFSWDSFIRHMVYVTNIQGSAMYDATLGDNNLIDQIFDRLVEEQSKKIKSNPEDDDILNRPPRRGYSREVEALYDLTDNIVALRAEMGKWSRMQTSRVMVKRPLFPAEAAQERMRKRAARRRENAIVTAQARWLKENG